MLFADESLSSQSAKSESDGEGLKEVQSVHKSLSAMHDVLKSAAAGKEGSHSQFGSTQLTKILMNYVGANGRCMLLVLLPTAKSAAKVACYTCFAWSVECVCSSSM